MKIAFYIAKHGTIIDKLINFFTERRGFSHCEFIFSDGRWFSSSARDGGCRFKRINPNYKHWRIFHFPISWENEVKLREFCESLVERKIKYDYRGVLGFVIPEKPERGKIKRLFCSESLALGLQQIIFLHSEYRINKISPADLFYIMLNLLIPVSK